MRLIPVLFFICCSFTTWAQLVQVPILRQAGKQNKKTAERIQQLPAKTLPFWDDFSFTRSQDYPNDTLWQYGNSVWVNSGMGINTQTLNVATFDGIDSLGKPYSANPYAKGIADRLTSRPLRMDLVSPADSIYIFFYYQYEGNGEAPDLGDELSLWMKNAAGEWSQAWTVGVSDTSDYTRFIPVKLMIRSSDYFHADFQFRFQNYARLSGPFDTWNLDYVYVSNGIKPKVHDFPDRAMAMPLTSLFKRFQSIPVEHFAANKDSVVYPSFIATNQRVDQNLVIQPIGYTSYVSMFTRKRDKSTSSTTVSLGTGLPVGGGGLLYGEFHQVTLQTLPDFSFLDSTVDSLSVKFDNRFDKSDNISKNNDYDSLAYAGINFHYNDTTRSVFTLSDYYAYDDGIAEYAVTLTQPGSMLAYQFDMVYSQPDTLVALDLYFPHVGDESNQIILIKVWNDLVTPQIDSLLWTVQRTEKNQFIRVPFESGLLVKDQFFVGWEQNSTATIGIGFDKNSDSGNKIFYNTAGTWLPGDDLHGNLMIRPVFGNRDINVVSGVEEKKTFAFPNPNHGIFSLPLSAQNVNVVDVAGRRISFIEEDGVDQKQITITNSYSGLYLVRYFNGRQWRTEKIMVLP